MATFTYALDDAIPEVCRGGALTIGNFDGVHVGHQALLAEAIRQARPAVAVTFDPHPIQLLRPEAVQPFLTTLAQRAALLHSYGFDHVLILRTSGALLQLGAREFFERIVVNGLNAKALVEGFNFGFGRNREGTIDVLQTICLEKNVQLSLIPPQEVAGQVVSTSRVRGELTTGRVDIARKMLGRPYRIAGVVRTGAKRGATIGFPTANLHDVATLVPGNGVYAVKAMVGSQTWPGAANVGSNPTFGENARKIEVHLIGFSRQLYDQSLAVDFLQKIRDTKTFASVDELKEQIHRDVESATAICARS